MSYFKKPLISFDYAIKFLLRDKGSHDIISAFISAILETQGYKKIKIVSLLESESNKEDSKSKRSLADLIVEDEDKHKYIVEVERNLKNSFIHKSCFNTSRLIVDNLAEKCDYAEIRKVFHISLLYFPISNSGGTIYHGKTIIHEIETGEKLSVHIKNDQTGEVFDATEILPEYFFISIPSFKDRIESEMDEWLHVMKHEALPENYSSPYMAKVADKLNILKMTPEERDEYYFYKKQVYSDRDELNAALAAGEAKGREEGMRQGIAEGMAQGMAQGMAKGEAKGRAEGREEGKREVAKGLLSNNIEEEVISRVTGLSIEEIRKLKN